MNVSLEKVVDTENIYCAEIIVSPAKDPNNPVKSKLLSKKARSPLTERKENAINSLARVKSADQKRSSLLSEKVQSNKEHYTKVVQTVHKTQQQKQAKTQEAKELIEKRQKSADYKRKEKENEKIAFCQQFHDKKQKAAKRVDNEVREKADKTLENSSKRIQSAEEKRKAMEEEMKKKMTEMTIPPHPKKEDRDDSKERTLLFKKIQNKLEVAEQRRTSLQGEIKKQNEAKVQKYKENRDSNIEKSKNCQTSE